MQFLFHSNMKFTLEASYFCKHLTHSELLLAKIELVANRQYMQKICTFHENMEFCNTSFCYYNNNVFIILVVHDEFEFEFFVKSMVANLLQNSIKIHEISIIVSEHFDEKSMYYQVKKILTKSSSVGIITFISEDLAVIISVLSESLLKNIWHPSVLSMEIVGTLPKTQNEKNLVDQTISIGIDYLILQR